jgi:pyridoxine kinase
MFPLQLHGFEVSPIHSVQLSNHTGYAVFKGDVMQGDALDRLCDGLTANGFLPSYSHVLTGYMGSISFVRRVATLIKQLHEANPGVVYVFDPG